MANITLGSTGTSGFRFDQFGNYDFFDFEKYEYARTSSTSARAYSNSSNYTELTGTGLSYYYNEENEVVGVAGGTMKGLTQVTKGVTLFKATDLNVSAAQLMAAGEAENLGLVLNLLMAGDDKVIGSQFSDVIYGGPGADSFYGEGGNDTVSYAFATKGVVANLTNSSLNTNDAKGDKYSSIENLTGTKYADTLTGNSAANILNGGAGADKLVGGGGSDTASYEGATKGVVANLSNHADNTNDAKGDTYSSIENLTGTKYADTLTGTTGANTLAGGGGNDTLNGGSGNDILIGGAGADKLVGGSGSDTASYIDAGKAVVANLSNPSANTNDAKGDTYSSIENLTGSNYNDTLTGNSSANKLSGGLGNDVLTSGSGKDIFIFDTKLGSTNVDTITDFSVTSDTIWLDDDIFTEVGKVGDLSAAAFHVGSKAFDSTDRIIYDSATGKLWYDADGSGKGAAIQFAQLDKGLAITAGHFDIIA